MTLLHAPCGQPLVLLALPPAPGVETDWENSLSWCLRCDGGKGSVHKGGGIDNPDRSSEAQGVRDGRVQRLALVGSEYGVAAGGQTLGLTAGAPAAARPNNGGAA